MHFIDSHIHLQDYSLKEAEFVYDNALKNNVREFVVPSAHPSDWQKVIKTIKRFPGAIGALGIHPWYINDMQKNQLEVLEKYLKKYSALWVGECGIDGYKNPDIKPQAEILLGQAELAVKYNRPLIVHAVKAEKEFERLLLKLPERTIFDSFTGPLEWGIKLQKNGFYLGLNFTFFKKKDAVKMLNKLDLTKILLETDAPYQQSKNYVKNSPENLPVLAAAIATARLFNEIEITMIFNHNFKNFRQNN